MQLERSVFTSMRPAHVSDRDDPADPDTGRVRGRPVGDALQRPRVNGLFYLFEGSDLVVVASNAGSDTDPAWWLNLRDQPEWTSRSPASGRDGAQVV